MWVSERVLLGLALGVAACAPTDPPMPDAGQECIVFASDFAGYESWPTSYSVPAEADAAPPSTDGGCTSPHNFTVPRKVYINTTPPDGSTEFPVCTKIVKEALVTSDPSTWQVYGMVKQDNTFAPGSGCVGWNWLELTDSTNGATPANPTIVWQGANPPPNSYQGCQACSSCHTNAQNDCVWMIPLTSF
jgi:hypothetical protein